MAYFNNIFKVKYIFIMRSFDSSGYRNYMRQNIFGYFRYFFCSAQKISLASLLYCDKQVFFLWVMIRQVADGRTRFGGDYSERNRIISSFFKEIFGGFPDSLFQLCHW